MTHKIMVDDFMKISGQIPLLDVRTPAEFNHGHVPGAFNIPLFSNEERVQVGTIYKQVGREAAILLGFDLTGAKWSGFIRQALEIAPQKKVAVHCWRGGMRSGAMAWALDLYGFQVYLLEGGYKRYRRWVQDQFAKSWDLRIIGGRTGSGKTRILHTLRAMDHQAVDLEDLAQHQGSSYGTLNRLVQPSQEQFENNMAEVLHGLDIGRPIWVEDESKTIGKRLVPPPFWQQMYRTSLFDLQVPVEARVSALAEEYGTLDEEFLVECTERINRRLGSEQTRKAIEAIREHRMEDFIRLVLVYYDKTYLTGLQHRDPKHIFEVPVNNTDVVSNSRELLQVAERVQASTQKQWT